MINNRVRPCKQCKLAFSTQSHTKTTNLRLGQEVFARHPSENSYQFWKARVVEIDPVKTRCLLDFYGECRCERPAIRVVHRRCIQLVNRAVCVAVGLEQLWVRWDWTGIYYFQKVENNPLTAQLLLIRNTPETDEWRLAKMSTLEGPTQHEGVNRFVCKDKAVQRHYAKLLCVASPFFLFSFCKELSCLDDHSCSGFMWAILVIMAAGAIAGGVFLAVKCMKPYVIRLLRQKPHDPHSVPGSYDNQSDQCPICLLDCDDITTAKWLTPFKCQHRIHAACASQLFEQQQEATCPHCRSARATETENGATTV